jgi:feruloyl esterase
LPFADLPAFCRVAGTIRTSPETTIRLEGWMPASGWNEKFLATGYAFFGNAMNPAQLAGPVRSGYATATTDNGLPPGASAQNGQFLIGQPRFFLNTRNLGPRASPSTTPSTRALATYGAPATMSPASFSTSKT